MTRLNMTIMSTSIQDTGGNAFNLVLIPFILSALPKPASCCQSARPNLPRLHSSTMRPSCIINPVAHSDNLGKLRRYHKLPSLQLQAYPTCMFPSLLTSILFRFVENNYLRIKLATLPGQPSLVASGKELHCLDTGCHNPQLVDILFRDVIYLPFIHKEFRNIFSAYSTLNAMASPGCPYFLLHH